MQFRLRQNCLAHLLESFPGKRTPPGVGASAVEKRKQSDLPGRIVGEHAWKTIAIKHDPEWHPLNMVERVTSGGREGEAGAGLRGNGRVRHNKPGPSGKSHAERAKDASPYGHHLDAARRGTSSEALVAGPENFI